MTSTVFAPGTVIAADWLNDVNNHVYGPGITLGGTSISDFSLTNSTPSNRAVYASTNPAGWNTGYGRMTFDTQFTCVNYFAQNPSGHFAIVLRQDPALVATAVRGQGVALGNFTGLVSNYASNLNPTSLLETWFNGNTVNGNTYGNFLWQYSETARSLKLLDNILYRIIVDSSVCYDGNNYLRYRLFQYDTANGATGGDWICLVDTGDVLDFNTGYDKTQSCLMLGTVFGGPGTTWSINFTHAKVTWGPAEHGVPDMTTKLSRFGAELQGNLDFINSTGGSLITAPANAGPSLANSLAFQSSSTNSATTVVVKPSGSATTANHLYSNNSASTSTYQSVSVGIQGSTALIQTISYASTDPDFGISIGATRTMTVNASGINLSVPLVFPTTGRIYAPANAGPSLDTSLTFQSNTTNTATTVVVKPNGTSSIANHLYSNNSSSTSTYGALQVGMSGTDALIGTLALSTTNPNIVINVGATNSATFKSTGLNILGATVDVGQSIGLSVNLTGFGGTNQTTFCTTANVNWDTACAIGYISTFIGGTYNAGNIENVIRPLWCLLGYLINDLKAKKVI